MPEIEATEEMILFQYVADGMITKVVDRLHSPHLAGIWLCT